MGDAALSTSIAPTERLLTAAEFQGLAEVPPEIEWFNNLSNRGTRRVYKNTIRDFMRFTGMVRPDEFRIVTRAHVIAWRDDLERRGLEGPTRRNRLAALSSLFEYLCNNNAVTHNRSKGFSARRRKAAKARRRQSAITRRASFSRRRRKKPSRPSATARSCRHFSSTRYDAKSSASSQFRIPSTRAAACLILKFLKSRARARRRDFSRSIPEPMR